MTPDYPARSYAWYVVILLYVAYALAFVDRQILAFLVAPIRAAFRISDFQFSLVQGLAFVIFYSVLGIPIARLADRRSRRNLIVAGVGLWSVMTMLCGLAGSYLQLFLARLGVGVGEATLSPSAVSMIADYFPPDERSLPINVYAAGVQGGAGLASICAGLVVSFAMGGGAHGVALLGHLQPWQISLMLVGLPGLAVSLAMLTVREPPRRERREAGSTRSFGVTLRYLRAHWLVYATLMVGTALAALAAYGAFSWVPALYARRFGWSAARIGLDFGVITIVGGTAGLVVSGIVAGRMAAAKRAAPYTWLMIASLIGAVAPAALLVAVRDPYWTLACVALLVLFLSSPIGLVMTALQSITPNEMRAQVIAVYLLIVALIGSAFGPSLVAAMTDYYYHSDAAVGSSIAVVTAAASALGAVILSLGIGAYRRQAAMPAAA